MENNNTNDIKGKATAITSKITAACDEQGSKVISFLKAKIPALSKYKMSQVLLYTNLAATALALLLYFAAPAITGPKEKDPTKKESHSISAMVSDNGSEIDDYEDKKPDGLLGADADAVVGGTPYGKFIEAAKSFNFYAKFFMFIMLANIALGAYMFATKKVIPYLSVRWLSVVSFFVMLMLFFKNSALAEAINSGTEMIAGLGAMFGADAKIVETSTSFGPMLMLLVSLIVAFSGFLIPANKEE